MSAGCEASSSSWAGSTGVCRSVPVVLGHCLLQRCFRMGQGGVWCCAGEHVWVQLPHCARNKGRGRGCKAGARWEGKAATYTGPSRAPPPPAAYTSGTPAAAQGGHRHTGKLFVNGKLQCMHVCVQSPAILTGSMMLCISSSVRTCFSTRNLPGQADIIKTVVWVIITGRQCLPVIVELLIVLWRHIVAAALNTASAAAGGCHVRGTAYAYTMYRCTSCVQRPPAQCVQLHLFRRSPRLLLAHAGPAMSHSCKRISNTTAVSHPSHLHLHGEASARLITSEYGCVYSTCMLP
jgi:hypothetical protein